jgi:hypothetical protein|tara:strand:+ start:402 stop:557 length:156 start_codon:yes stop_codon:yes gene_type:complete
MERYILTLKDKKEVINTHHTHSLLMAITYFAAVKKISESDLLKIYDVIKQK